MSLLDRSKQPQQQHKSLQKQRLGKIGESYATQFLVNKGYRILERNFKKRYGELDIVALDGPILVFVEVKTRVGNTYGKPEEAVTPRKLHEVIQTAYYYKMIHPELPESLRIDVIAIELAFDDRLIALRHIPNVTM